MGRPLHLRVKDATTSARIQRTSPSILRSGCPGKLQRRSTQRRARNRLRALSRVVHMRRIMPMARIPLMVPMIQELTIPLIPTLIPIPSMLAFLLFLSATVRAGLPAVARAGLPAVAQSLLPAVVQALPQQQHFQLGYFPWQFQ